MMDATETAVIERLKKAGLYESFAAQVSKDMTAADVHKPTALGNEPDEKDPKKKKPEERTEASGVDKAFSLTIEKIAPDKQYIYGWASVSSLDGVDVIDKQDDVVPIEELEKGVYEFVKDSRTMRDMHSGERVGSMILSMIYNSDMEACGHVYKNAAGQKVHGWFVGFHVEDAATWALIKGGSRPEFSIGGRATRT